MDSKKFNPEKLQMLNDPQRLVDIPPDYIIGKLNTAAPEVLVDIGAGTAFFSIAFTERLNNAKVYACDTSDVMIDWIKENVSPVHPEVIPVKNEENSIPLEDGISDLVYMINMHHELENPLSMLEEAHRLLKPGGKIVIVDWRKTDMPEGPPTAIRYLPEKVREQMIETGFVEVNIFDELPKHFMVTGEKGSAGTLVHLPNAIS